MVKALRGVIRVPGDKSLSHRIALFSAMAEGVSTVQGLLDSFDLRSTLGIVKTLGAKVELTSGLDGLSGSIKGWGSAGPVGQLGYPEEPDATHGLVLDCGNSGTTARLMLGVLSGYGISACLTGDSSLCKRPMTRVTQPLSLMGAEFALGGAVCDPLGEVASDTGDKPENKSGDTLPLWVRGKAQLKAIEYISPVASAQVKSAVLLAGLHSQGITRVTEPHKSRDHTELVLPAYGVKVVVEDLMVSIEGGQTLHACDSEVPGDPSSAAFLLVAAALIPGSVVTVKDVLLNPTRIGFLEVMRRMGADIAIEKSAKGQLGAEQVGDIRVSYTAGLQATTVKASEIASLIDEVPILALLATAAQGETVFEQVGELRVKESDRLEAIIRGLKALGSSAYAAEDDLHVLSGKLSPTGDDLETQGDHRLAMTWGIAALATGEELAIIGKECVGVSYPGFFEDLKRLS